jgi:hypothetical protein
MNTKLHSTSTESHSECGWVASFTYISTAIREMSKMCGSEKQKKLTQARGSCQQLSRNSTCPTPPHATLTYATWSMF